VESAGQLCGNEENDYHSARDDPDIGGASLRPCVSPIALCDPLLSCPVISLARQRSRVRGRRVRGQERLDDLDARASGCLPTRLRPQQLSAVLPVDLSVRPSVLPLPSQLNNSLFPAEEPSSPPQKLPTCLLSLAEPSMYATSSLRKHRSRSVRARRTCFEFWEGGKERRYC
jgi:hypothetical protein